MFVFVSLPLLLLPLSPLTFLYSFCAIVINYYRSPHLNVLLSLIKRLINCRSLPDFSSSNSSRTRIVSIQLVSPESLPVLLLSRRCLAHLLQIVSQQIQSARQIVTVEERETVSRTIITIIIVGRRAEHSPPT